MAFESAGWVALATRMLSDKGAQFEVVRPGGVTRTSAGEVATPEDRGHCFGVAARYSLSQIDGKSILKGDVKFISDVGTWVMQVGDLVNIGGAQYRCEDPGVVAPDGTPLDFISQFRRVGQ